MRKFNRNCQFTKVLSIISVWISVFFGSRIGFTQILKNDSIAIITEEIPKLNNKSDLSKTKLIDRDFFLNSLRNENLWDNESVSNLKGYYLNELGGKESFFDINDIEYYSNKLSFLEFLKGAKEYRLDSLLSLNPTEYLKGIYTNAFKIIGIESLISNFKIVKQHVKGNNSKEFDYQVLYSLNGIGYKDSYYHLNYFMKAYKEELRNNPFLNIQDFHSILLSRDGINLLLADLGSSKRLIVTRLGNILKYYFIKKEIAFAFDEFTYANSISEIESTIEGAMNVGLIKKLNDKQLNKISKKYRENHRQINTFYIFEFAGSEEIIKFQNYGESYLEADWIIPLKKLTSKHFKIDNFKDNKTEFLNNILKAKNSKTDAPSTILYNFEYDINGKHFQNSIFSKRGMGYKLEIENIFNSINQNINQTLEKVKSNKKIYCDGIESIYLLNEEQKAFLTNEKFGLDLK